jgi:D-alanyl-D-alanine dipeptidase
MCDTEEVYQQRQKRAAAAMETAGADALLLGPGADMRYLTGFEHSHAGERLLAFFLRQDGAATWIAPVMNVAQIREHALAEQQIRAWTDAEGYLSALKAAVAGVEGLAFDDETRAAFLLDLLSVAPRAHIRKASSVMRGLRQRKDAAEVERMRAAARTVDDTIPEAIALCRPGRREIKVEEELRAALGRRSPESSVAFSIIASGPNAALPHHETGLRELRRGDVAVLDYGTRLDGYHSDITVTCAIGEPSDPEARKIYRVVWEAQQRALEAVRPGVPCREVDRAARDHIAAAGYGDYFLHRTGHGLGLQVHEPPYLVGGNEELLEEGMVFSVEPGIYLPGRFGVRLEVIASVAADGVSLINAPSAEELPLAPV